MFFLFQYIKMEAVFNIAFSFSVCLYSFYNVFLFGKNIDTLNDTDVFINGWSIIDRRKDISDYEWTVWKGFSLELIPWLFFYFFGAECVRQKKIYLKLWCCLISFVFIIYKFGVMCLLLFILQPSIYLLLIRLGGKVCSIWTCSCIFLMAINMLKNFYDDITKYRLIGTGHLKEEDCYMILVAISWIQLRSISYSLEAIELSKDLNLSNTKKSIKQNTKPKISVINMLSYVFYLPLLFLGPCILYNEFENSINLRNQRTIYHRSMCLMKNLVRYLGWLVFIELSLHFMYVNALQYNIQVMWRLPDWCLFGAIIWMGIYFYMKYLVIYGLSGTMAAFDNIHTITPPRCVLRVCRYSEMWKYFDVGLHKFLIKYIYKPFIKSFASENILVFYATKYFASFVCFTFVFLWHGTHHFIFVWTFLNFIGIVLESIGTIISQSAVFKKIRSSYIRNDHIFERITAFLSTPILIMSALSNMYFFAGSEFGDFCVTKLFDISILSFTVMFLCLYSFCRSAQSLSHLSASKICT